MNRTPLDVHDEADALDRALDGLAHGDRSRLTRLDSETHATIDRLFTWAAIGGVADAAPQCPRIALSEPDSTAAIRWKGPVPMDTALRQPSPVYATLPRAKGRVVPAIWSAIAWLMISAVAGASLYGAVPLLRDQDAASPTLNADLAAAANGEVNYGGDAGRTWHLGSTEPLPGEPEVMLAGSASQVLGSPLIVSDSLFYATVDGGEVQYHRYDLDSAEPVWESDVAIIGSAASDGERIFGFVMRNPGADASLPVPVAISIETGKLAWEAQPLVLGSDSNAAGPVLLGEMVYFSDALGNTVALDSITGAVAWQYPETYAPRVNYADADVVNGNPPDADMVATQRGIFVERPSTTIVRLDPATGEELDSFNLIDDFGADIQQVGMQATADRLVITATRSEKAPLGGDAAPPYRPTSILIFDTGTLALVAESGMPEVASNLVLTDDAVLVAGRTDLTAPLGLYRIDQATGDAGDPIHEFERGPTSWTGLSASGTTLMMVDHENEFETIDLTSGSTLASGTIDVERAALLTSPFQLWREQPILVTSNGDIVTITATPQQP